MKRFAFRAALALGCLCVASPSFADYPERPVRLVVPFSPGGGSDLTSRLISQHLSESLGKPVIVENRPGGAGNIATEAVARASADGYTLLLATLSTAVNVSLFQKLPFNPLTDFDPVSLVVTVPLLVVVHPSLPVSNIQELIKLANAKPGQLNYASGGIGTANHVGGELFKHMAHVQIAHVPYKGGGPALADVAGGHVQLFFGTMTATRDLAKSGRLRPLATTSAARSPSWPELPTVAESGLADFEVSAWFGVLAPAGTPKSIVARLSGELARMVRVQEVRDGLLAQGNDPVGSSEEDFGRHLRNEIDKWARVVHASGLRAD
jgi:tripartite-type tricarboxylate transporter receptor subunit TctC